MIFRSDNRGRWSEDGERKGARSHRVADTKKYEGCPEVFGTSKLLQIVCEIFCYDNKALA